MKGSYKDAQKELTKLLGQADAGTLADPSKQTVAEYTRANLATAVDLAPKTRERYVELAEHQIIPHLGDIKLAKLKPEHLAEWHAVLLKTLSRRTVLHAHRCLSRVLTDAVALGTLGRNVAAVRRPPAVEDDELVILTEEQVQAVLTSLMGEITASMPVVALALATGMRRGELLALEWRDIDLDAGTLRVERSLEETKAGLRVKAPKTKRGRRKIALPAESVSMLRDHRKRQIELRLALGQGGQPTLVFSTLEGRHIKPNSVTRDWSRLPQEAAQGQIPRLEAHSRLAVDRRRR